MSNFIKGMIKNVPLINKVFIVVKRFFLKEKPFKNSEQYWIERYNSGGDSGYGSYGRHAEFKAKIINTFIKDNNVQTVIEFGCGDGNQLKYLELPSYIGYDISSKAIDNCNQIFKTDSSKSFRLIKDYSPTAADLTLSLDVIYHLIEDEIFDSYMKRLFESSNKYVIIYAWDVYQPEENRKDAHVKHRLFSKWVKENKPQFTLQSYIPDNLSAHFYIYKLTN